MALLKRRNRESMFTRDLESLLEDVMSPQTPSKSARKLNSPLKRPQKTVRFSEEPMGQHEPKQLSLSEALKHHRRSKSIVEMYGSQMTSTEQEKHLKI